MYNLNKLKVLVIGPEGSGKTAIVNFLCQKSNVLDAPYRPTVGSRIIETEKQVKNKRVTIEFWDVSGNNKFEKCWPAIQKGAQGVIIVYNADNPKSETQVEYWIQKFPKALNIPTAQCVCFAHHLSEMNRQRKSKSIKGASNLSVSDTSIEDGPSTILPAFDKFLNSLVASLAERQQKEENNLMNDEA